MASDYEFDVDAFRVSYPEFTDSPEDAVLESDWTIATCYMSDINYGCLNGDCRYLALTMLTAHIAKLAIPTNAGQTTSGLEISATIDKITVATLPPPNTKEFSWWLNKTSYGQNLLALLRTRATGGLYFPGPGVRCWY
jgi:hypothetical protein